MSLDQGDRKEIIERIEKLEKSLKEQEQKRIKGWDDYRFLQDGQIKRQDYLDKELSELKVCSAAHTESEDGIRRHTTKNEKEIAELKEHQLEDHNDIYNIREVLREFFIEMKPLNLRFYIDFQKYLDKLGGDTSDIVSGTGGAEPTRNSECEDGNPEIIDESQPPSCAFTDNFNRCNHRDCGLEDCIHPSTCTYFMTFDENPSEQSFDETIGLPTIVSRKKEVAEVPFRALYTKFSERVATIKYDLDIFSLVEKADLERLIEEVENEADFTKENSDSPGLRSIASTDLQKVKELRKKYLPDSDKKG